MKRNLGSQPPETIGRRVRVELRNGLRPAETWAADGRGGCCWERAGSDFDIVKWELA